MKKQKKEKKQNEKSAVDYINELTDRAMDYTSQKIEDIERKVNDIILNE